MCVDIKHMLKDWCENETERWQARGSLDVVNVSVLGYQPQLDEFVCITLLV